MVQMSLGSKKCVLMLVNHDVVIYNFRLELVEQLLADGYEVHISSPYGERISDLISLGAVFHETAINRHGKNPIDDVQILNGYRKLIGAIHPVIVLGYTIKPNIYGAMAARSAGVPFVANITGLGTAVENSGAGQWLAVLLYKAAFTRIQRVFFQNEENMRFFLAKNIAAGRYRLLPGSGVNLERYPFTPLPQCGNGKTGKPVKFAFISRIMKEKGIEQYLAAAKQIRTRYPAAEFHVCGFCENEYKGRLGEMSEAGTVTYHGMIRDVAGFMRSIHCVVHPTYYPEGLSNVLLEACSSGRVVITTNRAGCREVVEDGVNGYVVPQKDIKSLTDAIKRFLELPQKDKERMGQKCREIVEEKFDRKIVVRAYMDEIRRAEAIR